MALPEKTIDEFITKFMIGQPKQINQKICVRDNEICTCDPDNLRDWCPYIWGPNTERAITIKSIIEISETEFKETGMEMGDPQHSKERYWEDLDNCLQDRFYEYSEEYESIDDVELEWNSDYLNDLV